MLRAPPNPRRAEGGSEAVGFNRDPLEGVLGLDPLLEGVLGLDPLLEGVLGLERGELDTGVRGDCRDLNWSS